LLLLLLLLVLLFVHLFLFIQLLKLPQPPLVLILGGSGGFFGWGLAHGCRDVWGLLIVSLTASGSGSMMQPLSVLLTVWPCSWGKFRGKGLGKADVTLYYSTTCGSVVVPTATHQGN